MTAGFHFMGQPTRRHATSSWRTSRREGHSTAVVDSHPRGTSRYYSISLGPGRHNQDYKYQGPVPPHADTP